MLRETVRKSLNKLAADIPNTEELSGSSSKGDVRTSKVVDGSLGKHGVVLNLGFTERRTIASNEDELGYTDPDRIGKETERMIRFMNLLSTQIKSVLQSKETRGGRVFQIMNESSPLPERICLSAVL